MSPECVFMYWYFCVSVLRAEPGDAVHLWKLFVKEKKKKHKHTHTGGNVKQLHVTKSNVGKHASASR